jgi:putative hydrolase of the HAD superfamily
MIAAVLFDLDDTLYPQTAWLDGAWAAVAAQGAAFGVPEVEFLAALHGVAALGSDRGRIIDRALARCGCGGVAIAPLVDAFRAHAPAVLQCYPGVAEALRALAARVPVGIVTDGDPAIQRAKIRALGLAVDVVVCSDEHGRRHRKPDPLPFANALDALALDALALDARDVVFVGDRPDKDVAGAIAAGMRAIRVRSGEYASRPDDPAPWRSVATAVDAMELLQRAITGAATGAGNSASPASARGGR